MSPRRFRVLMRALPPESALRSIPASEFRDTDGPRPKPTLGDMKRMFRAGRIRMVRREG